MSLNRPETRTSRAWDWPRSGIVSEIRSQGREWTGIKTAALCEDEGLRVKSQLCHANSVIQPLHVCPWLCVERSQRALGHISSEESLIIDSSDTLQRVIFSLSLSRRNAIVFLGFLRWEAVCSFWTVPSLSRRLRGLTLFVWPLKEEFSTRCLPRREQLFSPSCFIDTGGSGSPQSVWQCFYRENIDASARRC